MPRDLAEPLETHARGGFDPQAPLRWTPKAHRDVVMVPWGENPPGGARRAAGLFDETGTFMPEGHCWRAPERPLTVAPVPPIVAEDVERLQGTWLFGGLFYGHFGHFLVETTARLWAIEHAGPIQGLVFYPKQSLTHERRHFRDFLPFFDAMGLGDLAIRVPQKPVVIDAVLTPPPGFGLGAMMAGRPDFRRFMRARFAHIAPRGAEKIYISRRHLTSKRGSLLQEAWMEAQMEAEGYRIVHPQELSIFEQVAQWKAARSIVAADGSALHLAAIVADPVCKVAILNRGPSSNIEDYITQFEHFAGITPLRIDAVTGYYHRADRKVVRRETHTVLDLAKVGAALSATGFLGSDAPWKAAPAAPDHDDIATLEARLGALVAYHAA